MHIILLWLAGEKFGPGMQSVHFPRCARRVIEKLISDLPLALYNSMCVYIYFLKVRVISSRIFEARDYQAPPVFERRKSGKKICCKKLSRFRLFYLLTARYNRKVSFLECENTCSILQFTATIHVRIRDCVFVYYMGHFLQSTPISSDDRLLPA